MSAYRAKNKKERASPLDAQEKLGLDYAHRKGFEIVKAWRVFEPEGKNDAR